MGWGDELMVTGQARAAQSGGSVLPVVVLDRNGNIRSHEAWALNPRIVPNWDRRSPVHLLHNGPGVRPYIAAKSEERWTWKVYACTPGEIYFHPHELFSAPTFRDRSVVLIEPNNKAKASINKDWGRANWQRLADLLRREGLRPVQFGTHGSQVLRDVEFFPTATFRIACAALANVRAAILPEGGLHHAAAALGIPAVVIYGGYISPAQTGYSIHRNIFTGGEPCGMRHSCAHCKKAMGEISPEMVLHNFMEVLACRDSTMFATQQAG